MPAALEWQFEVGAKIDGLVAMVKTLDESVGKLGAVDKATTKTNDSLGKLGDSAKKPVDEMEMLNKRLAELERPGKLAGLRQKIKDLEHPTKEVGHHAVNIGHSFDEAKEKVMGFGEAIGLALAVEGVAILIEKVKELGLEVLKAGAGEQRKNNAFGFAFGEDAEFLDQYAEQYRKLSEFQGNAVDDMILRLGRAGFAAQEIPRAMAAAGDIAARFGNKVQGLESGLGALAMIKATGKVEGKHLRGLGLGAGSEELFFEKLAERTGKSVATMKALMDKGKVSADDSIEALYTILAGKRGKLGGAVLKMGEGMEAKFTHFAEIPEKIFESVEKSPAFERFGKFVGDMTSKLGPDGPLGAKLAEGLGKGFDAIAGKLAKIDAKDIEGFVRALAALPGVIADLTVALTRLVPVASKVANVAGVAMENTGKIAERGKDALGALPVIGPAVNAYRAFRWAIGGNDHGPGEAGKASVDGFVGPVQAGHGQAKAAGENLGKAAVEGAKGPRGIDARSPSKKFAQLGRMSVDGYAQGVEQAADVSQAAARAVTPDAVLPAGRRGGGGGQAPQVNVSVAITVTAGAGGSPASAQEIAQEVRATTEEILPSILQSAFEKMRLQAGA